MLTLLTILILIALVLIVLDKKHKWLTTIGIFIILISISLILPKLINNKLLNIKENAIKEYIDGKVIVNMNYTYCDSTIIDSSYTYIWTIEPLELKK